MNPLVIRGRPFLGGDSTAEVELPPSRGTIAGLRLAAEMPLIQHHPRIEDLTVSALEGERWPVDFPLDPSRQRVHSQVANCRGLRSKLRVETGDLPYAGLSEALLVTLMSNCRDVGCAIKALE